VADVEHILLARDARYQVHHGRDVVLPVLVKAGCEAENI
jgi:hypothetical protein